MFTAALCFSGGFIISAFGVWWHQLWIIYLGYGVIGGCGLGLGYISPVSTLVKWFPDRPGMATGMAIMGFGGGAFIGSNLSLLLMDHFKSSTSTIQRHPAAEATSSARQCLCAHKLSVEQLLTNSGQLFAREHVHHPGAADARFHHHESGMFVHDSADDCGVFA